MKKLVRALLLLALLALPLCLATPAHAVAVVIGGGGYHHHHYHHHHYYHHHH